jgi:hypothetical protein
MTKALYNRLGMTFGMIAHFDLSGFWSEFFTRTEDKAHFLERIVTFPCHGDPEYTYSDVEKAIKSRVRHMGFHGYYVNRARTEAEAAERALARLQAK